MAHQSFSFSGTYAFRLGLCLFVLLSAVPLSGVHAELLYQKSPRFGPRTQENLPKQWPLLELSEPKATKPAPSPRASHKASANEEPAASAADDRVHAGFPPPIAPEAKPVRLTSHQKSSSEAHSKQSQQNVDRIVHRFPTRIEPLNSEIPTVLPKEESVAAAQVAKSTKKDNNNAKLAKAQPVEPAVIKKGKNKTIVHFPEALRPSTEVASSESRMLASNSSYSQGFGNQEPGMHPVSFSPNTTSAPAPSKNKTINTALMSQPNGKEAVLHYNRASYYGQQQQWDQAQAEYKQALALQPSFADAYVGLSSIFALKNQWEDVISTATKALNSHQQFQDLTNRAQAQYNLSLAYCVAADSGKAQSFYRAAKMANHPQAAFLADYISQNCSH